MKKPKPDIIATRILWRGKGKTRRKVTVTLEKPVETIPGEEWKCNYKISGISKRPVASHAYGVDSMQALQGALEFINVALNKAGDCSWFSTIDASWLKGNPVGMTGFSRSIPWDLGADFTERMTKLVTDEWFKEIKRLRPNAKL